MDNFNIDYITFDLPNGVKSFFYPTNKFNSIAIYVVVESGSLDEDTLEDGIMHFIEHLAFDGTKNMPSWEDVNKFHNEISGTGNAYTGYKDTVYYGVYPHKYLKEALFYYSEIVFHPTHSDDSINKEKTIILDELSLYEDEVNEKLFNLTLQNRFMTNDTSFSRKIIGTKESITKFDSNMISGAFHKFYDPHRIKLFIVGNFDRLQAESFVKKYFCDDVDNDRFGAGLETSYFDYYPDYSTFKVNSDTKSDIDKIYLSFSFPSFDIKSYSQKDRCMMEIMFKVLCSSRYQNSILWSKLREELGLVYDVSINNLDLYSRSFVEINTSFNPEYIEKILFEIYQGINKVKNGDFDESILNMIKKNINDTSLLRMDNIHNVVDWIITTQEEYDAHNQFMSYSEYISFIGTITKQDLVRVANSVFDFNLLNVSVVSKHDKFLMTNSVNEYMSSLFNKSF